MKRLTFALLCAAFSVSISAATLSPIQLLNPAGSTSGQAIVSTGPTTAPAWGSVVASSLAPSSPNTAIANTSGSSASPVAVALPSCSTANSGLKYTSGTGFSCGTTFALTSGNLSQFAATTSAQLSGVLSDETGTGVAVFGTSPTITTPNIVATATNNNAAAGSVGDFSGSTGSGVALTSATPTNGHSISLGAGDWDVRGSCHFKPGAGTVVTTVSAGLSTTSAVAPAIPLYAQLSNLGTNGIAAMAMPMQRFTLSGTTTIYAVVNSIFTTSTLTATCRIEARRPR